MQRVAFNSLSRQHARMAGELEEAARRVLASGWYIGGPEVERFEQEFAQFAGAPHAVGVANGTDAIALALRAGGVQPGDEVIVPALSAYPTTVGVYQAGAIPVFVDVQPGDGLIDVDAVSAAIGPRTRAVVPVHLYGTPCRMPSLAALTSSRGLILVEDCAQAHGAAYAGQKVGTRALAAAWSFYPTKNLGAVGDAGAVTTTDPAVAETLRRIRNYGQRNRYEHVERGWNSRLDPLQAAFLSVKLRYLEQDNLRRVKIAERYSRAFEGLSVLSVLQVVPEARSSRHLYPVVTRSEEERVSLQRSLTEGGVETLIHYPIAMPDQRATPEDWRGRGEWPNARKLARTVLSLPLYPELEDVEVDQVIDRVEEWARASG